jgi:hypothetical protein
VELLKAHLVTRLVASMGIGDFMLEGDALSDFSCESALSVFLFGILLILFRILDYISLPFLA